MVKKNQAPKRRQQRLSFPRRQREQKLVPQPTLMGRKRILDYLHDTIGMCEALFEEHGNGCECEACCITSNMVGTLRVFRMVLEIS
jgi:hypothetical protein